MRFISSVAFTILELLIVIIIIGVLIGIALPRLSMMVEHSRSSEAIANLATIRNALERCLLWNNKDISNCGYFPPSINQLDISDLSKAPNAHFSYRIMGRSQTPDPLTGELIITYVIRAERNTRDGGKTSDYIDLRVSEWMDTISITGGGTFANLRF